MMGTPNENTNSRQQRDNSARMSNSLLLLLAGTLAATGPAASLQAQRAPGDRTHPARGAGSPGYSVRNAYSGSIRAARRAGM